MITLKNKITITLVLLCSFLSGCSPKESEAPALSQTPVKSSTTSVAGAPEAGRVIIKSNHTISMSYKGDEKNFKTIEDLVSYVRTTHPDCRYVTIKSEVKMVTTTSDRIINAFGSDARILSPEPIVIQSFIVPTSDTPGSADLMLQRSRQTLISEGAWKQLTAPVTGVK